MRSTAVLGSTILFACLSVPALGYNEGGHLYTVSLITHRVVPAIQEPEANLITFCAQLPDESSDLDAATLYENLVWPPTISWIGWVLGSSGSKDVRRTAAVEQLLHALTGGDAEATHAVAGNLVSTLAVYAWSPGLNSIQKANALCALGFAMHLYGDSYAHRYMGVDGQVSPDDCPSGKPCMYPTGHGHGRDLHYPDYPMCQDFTGVDDQGSSACFLSQEPKWRFNTWAGYWQDAAYALTPAGKNGSLDSSYHSQLVHAAFQAEPPQGSDPHWSSVETNFQHALSMADSSAGGHSGAIADRIMKFFADYRQNGNGDEQICNVVMQLASASDDPVLKGMPHPSRCDDVWDLYFCAADREFNNPQYAAARAGTDNDSYYERGHNCSVYKLPTPPSRVSP